MNINQKQFKTFDPNPSLKFAVELLAEAGVKNFALIGRLAMWAHIKDESQHKYTKDVDFAIFLSDIEKVITVVKKKNLEFKNLQIGGIGIREEGISIDFIDRRLHGVQNLFTEALSKTDAFIEVNAYKVPVVSLEYLVAMKTVSGEPKDDEDLKMLLSLENLNYPNSRDIVERFLGSITAERLDVFAREAGILPKRGPYSED